MHYFIQGWFGIIKAGTTRLSDVAPRQESQVSRTTSEGFLSSRMATKVQCLKCPASVDWTNATWQISFGLTHRHWSIFSAVSDSPNREAFFSGISPEVLKGLALRLQ